jgi:hypothetical protein
VLGALPESTRLCCVAAVTLETTSNFQKIKDLLMGFVNSIVLVLYNKLNPQREHIYASLTQVCP